MAKQTKSKTIDISEKSGKFSTLFHKSKSNKRNPELSQIRKFLSNEKARLIHTIKTKQPQSIYQLAKLLGRDFKAVRQDVKLLENYEIIELISSYKHGRERLRPVIDIDQLIFKINL